MNGFRNVPSPEGSSSDQIRTKGSKSGALIAAFQILDTNRQGYFPKDTLLFVLTRKGDAKLDPEWVEGVLDEVSVGGRVYYKDICELFRETSLKAETVLDDKRKEEELKKLEMAQKEEIEQIEVPESNDILIKSMDTNSFGDSSDSCPSLEQFPLAAPVEEPDNASAEPERIPSTESPAPNGDVLSVIEPTQIQAAPVIEDYVTINSIPNEAAMESVEGSQDNIP